MLWMFKQSYQSQTFTFLIAINVESLLQKIHKWQVTRVFIIFTCTNQKRFKHYLSLSNMLWMLKKLGIKQSYQSQTFTFLIVINVESLLQKIHKWQVTRVFITTSVDHGKDSPGLQTGNRCDFYVISRAVLPGLCLIFSRFNIWIWFKGVHHQRLCGSRRNGSVVPPVLLSYASKDKRWLFPNL